MSSIVKSKRQSSIELLRVISMLLIIGYHFVCFRYKSYGSLNLYSLNNFVMSFLWAGGKYGVILFSLITGYFMINSKISFKKILKLEAQVLFYTLSIMFLFMIFKNKVVTAREWELFLFPTYEKTYWFFSGYFLLYLLMPLLNFIILKLKKEQFTIILGLLIGIFVLLPTVMINKNLFNESIYLIFYYIVGCYIRLYMDKIKGHKRFLIMSIVFYLAIIGSIILFQRLAVFNIKILECMYCFTQMGSILSFISAISLFIYFKKLKLKESKLINWLGSLAFGVYLFHEHTYMRKFLWFEVFDVNSIVNSPYFVFFTLLIVIFVFMIGGLYEWGRQIIFKGIGQVYLRCKKIYRKVIER